MFLVCPPLEEIPSCAFPILGGAKYYWRWLYVQLASEVIQALRPSSLVEDAEDAAGLPAVPQSPRTQGREQ